MAKNRTNYLSFNILLPCDCLLPPWDSDPQFDHKISIEVLYHTQTPYIAEVYDYHVNPICTEMIYWPDTNILVQAAVENNCQSFWDDKDQTKKRLR